MSKVLEEQLARVPERWRDATRTRAYAVMDYIAAGEDGSLLVDVLSRRVGLSRSAFHSLVRRWTKANGDAAALAPWARGADTMPRIAAKATDRIDEVAGPMLEEDVQRPTEPVAQHVLSTWPEALPRPGISYVRRRVNHLRAEREKKTRRVGRAAELTTGHAPARWSLDVIFIDHVAMETVVWADEEPTLPIATLAIDVATGRPVAARMTLDAPTPELVVAVLADLAADAAPRLAPGPPTISVATTHAPEWTGLADRLASTGARVAARRAKRLAFGGEAHDLLGGRLCGYRLAPRLGHRPTSERATPKAVLALEHRELEDLDRQLQALVATSRDELMREEAWPPAAAPDPATWVRLAALAESSPA